MLRTGVPQMVRFQKGHERTGKNGKKKASEARPKEDATRSHKKQPKPVEQRELERQQAEMLAQREKNANAKLAAAAAEHDAALKAAADEHGRQLAAKEAAHAQALRQQQEDESGAGPAVPPPPPSAALVGAWIRAADHAFMPLSRWTCLFY